MSDKILATNHVGFTVTDKDRAIAMFTEVFGYTLVSHGGRDRSNIETLTGIAGADIMVAHLRRPGLVGIELISYLAPSDTGRIDARPSATGYAHITFDVSDLDAVVAEAAAYGLMPLGGVITSTGDGPNNGALAIYLKDGDGISIELIQPARFAQG
ncbi:MAG: hypothetical protein JWN66_953 [Sphingomonas bacterium]|jgi:catechol 2,3-dioxygenase-like lactoylglutathione lyase family enzyme|uniref:VOC family protein n=1 Tax=Sphingomonas bacterium TaxID=1895847 RepID=UPI00263426C0|nr:VOC family protein [Sphingomonas bacterium]MDB5703837.1 hypothetical protein [Sphingomonas bacterium]